MSEDVVDTGRVEPGTPPDHAVHLVVLLQQEFRKVRTILCVRGAARGVGRWGRRGGGGVDGKTKRKNSLELTPGFACGGEGVEGRWKGGGGAEAYLSGDAGDDGSLPASRRGGRLGSRVKAGLLSVHCAFGVCFLVLRRGLRSKRAARRVWGRDNATREQGARLEGPWDGERNCGGQDTRCTPARCAPKTNSPEGARLQARFYSSLSYTLVLSTFFLFCRVNT